MSKGLPLKTTAAAPPFGSHGAACARIGLRFATQGGSQPTVSAVAALAYDCRRSELITDQLCAVLALPGRGILSPYARGTMHG